MATYGKQDFTSFRAVNIRSSVAFRFAADVYGNEATLAVKPSEDTANQWYFPAKNGTFPIMGTFVVQIPANAGLVTALSTLVTVSGIRAEDAVVVQFNKGVSAGYNLINTAYIILSASPGNGNILLTYMTGGGGTAYLEQICSYLAVR